MDNFMDKLAQKFSAQEVIKANLNAEAEEMKRLQLQVSEYEKILQEMRKLNYKNTELSGKLDALIGENAGKIQAMKEDEQKLLVALRDLTDEQTRLREEEFQRKEEERLAKGMEEELKSRDEVSKFTNILEERMQRSDDFVHKENVKVYRNVQAVVVDEFKKYSESAQGLDFKYEERLNALDRKINKKLNAVVGLNIFSVLISVVSFIGMVLLLLLRLGVLK